MRRLLILSAAICLSACGLVAPAYPQFGETSYRVEGDTAAPDGGPVIHTVIYRQGPNLRVETVLPHYGRAIVVFDRTTDAAYVLNPTIQATTTSPNTPTVQPSGAPGRRRLRRFRVRRRQVRRRFSLRPWPRPSRRLLAK